MPLAPAFSGCLPMSPRRKRKGVATSIILLVLLILLAGALWWGRGWLNAHPQHNPWAPLALDQPVGWATHRKLAALPRGEGVCGALLRDGGVRFDALPDVGEAACRAPDRVRLAEDAARSIVFRPVGAAPSCAVAAGFVLWMRDSVTPAAKHHFGQRIARVEHLGSYSCRPIAGGGGWSEHATANALDISAFILADGTRISLIDDWNGDPARAAFLRDVRDGACDLYSTVLSPDYNRAHADHFHFDMADRAGGWQVCR